MLGYAGGLEYDKCLKRSLKSDVVLWYVLCWFIALNNLFQYDMSRDELLSDMNDEAPQGPRPPACHSSYQSFFRFADFSSISRYYKQTHILQTTIDSIAVIPYQKSSA